jgi:ribosome-associated heat shock protein Hsp15
MAGVRVDKFLWSTRIFKTRSIATKACKNNKVKMDGEVVKPAKEITIGDEVDVKKRGVWFRYLVLELLKKRVGAKLVPDYIEDITPPEEKEKLQVIQTRVQFDRDKGTGRPTKKERRELDDFLSYWDGWEDD